MRLAGVEDAWGTRLDDTLLGYDRANRLYGGDGNDLLDGRVGRDHLDGEGGMDTCCYDPNDELQQDCEQR